MTDKPTPASAPTPMDLLRDIASDASVRRALAEDHFEDCIGDTIGHMLEQFAWLLMPQITSRLEMEALCDELEERIRPVFLRFMGGR